MGTDRFVARRKDAAVGSEHSCARCVPAHEVPDVAAIVGRNLPIDRLVCSGHMSLRIVRRQALEVAVQDDEDSVAEGR